MKLQFRNVKGKIDHTIEFRAVAGIKFQTNGRIIKKRVKRFYSKEPKTIEWIDTFKPTETFLDVGANIGQYSLYAAKKGISVYAFEPQALNYAELYTNIYLNNLGHKINGYCIALSNTNTIEYLSLLSMVPGQSHNDYAIDIPGQIKQGCVGFTLDYLVEKKVIPQPTHIKIDVDGIESKVIEGGTNTIKNCKTVLIEVENMEIVNMITKLGFKIDNNFTFEFETAPEVDKKIFNYIFKKE
jgi:FkbM family methyltransferase